MLNSPKFDLKLLNLLKHNSKRNEQMHRMHNGVLLIFNRITVHTLLNNLQLMLWWPFR